MVLRDKHAMESTAEVDPNLIRQLATAEASATAWTEEVERLKDKLRQEMGDAFAATVNGVKVYTNRPKNQYALAALMRDYPDLTQHYMVTRVVEALDVEAFGDSHPKILEQYHSRALARVQTTKAQTNE
jgi:hypothetical protein